MTKTNAVPGIVLDTNIYISAIMSGGIPELLLELARKEKIKIGISEDILQELTRVLREKFKWNDKQVGLVTRNIRKITTSVVPTKKITILSDIDESDNRILEAALRMHADIIISGDKHLLNLKKFKNIPIITARQFLDKIV